MANLRFKCCSCCYGCLFVELDFCFPCVLSVITLGMLLLTYFAIGYL